MSGKPTGPASSGTAKPKVSLSSLSPDDVSALKDELLKTVASRAAGATAEAYGRHSNVHSSNSNAELAKAAQTKT
jgi:hypothetical protein